MNRFCKQEILLSNLLFYGIRAKGFKIFLVRPSTLASSVPLPFGVQIFLSDQAVISDLSQNTPTNSTFALVVYKSNESTTLSHTISEH